MKRAKLNPTNFNSLIEEIKIDDLSDNYDIEDSNNLHGYPGPYSYAIKMWNTQLCCSMNPTFRKIFHH